MIQREVKEEAADINKVRISDDDDEQQRMKSFMSTMLMMIESKQ